MTSHMITSTPSVPAFSMICVVVRSAIQSGSDIMLSMHFRSNSTSTMPARSPCNWCDMPPVPKITTFRSSG